MQIFAATLGDAETMENITTPSATQKLKKLFHSKSIFFGFHDGKFWFDKWKKILSLRSSIGKKKERRKTCFQRHYVEMCNVVENILRKWEPFDYF